MGFEYGKRKIIIKGDIKYIYDIILLNKNEFASFSFEEYGILKKKKKNIT